MSDYQLFVGRLPRGTRSRDLEDVFYKYGKLTRCDVKQGIKMAYGFIEYEDKRDAEDALRGEHGRDFMGARIVVEWARGPKEGGGGEGGRGEGGRGGGGRGGGRYDYRRESRDRYRDDYDDHRDYRRDDRYSRYERERRYSRSRSGSRERDYYPQPSYSRDRDYKRRSFSRSPSRERHSRSRS